MESTDLAEVAQAFLSNPIVRAIIHGYFDFACTKKSEIVK
jgi:hypothetical protein